MNGGLIAHRYAKALLGYAYERDKAEVVYREMEQVAANFIAAPEIYRVLKNPTLTATQKLDLLVAAVGEKVSEEFRTFTEMVISNSREDYFQSITVMYMELYREFNQINIASLTTASPISSEIEASLKDKLLKYTEGSIEFDSKIDPEVLGGFIFEMNHLRLDTTVATQLKQVRKELEVLNSKSSR